MNSGRLNKKITIWRRNTGTDDDGYVTDSWEVFKNTWAEIKNINGKEFFEANRSNVEVEKKVLIRYIKELDSAINENSTLNFRVQYKNTFYNILYVDNIKEGGRYIEMMLKREGE